MEEILKNVNARSIALSDEEIRRNNQILGRILSTIISNMRAVDALFNQLFDTVFYGGSFYDGLRVGQPKEFDIDLLLKLDRYADVELTTSNIPGFVTLKLNMKENSISLPGYNKLAGMLDNRNYLCTNKVLRWWHSLVQRAINIISFDGTFYPLEPGEDFQMTAHEGGPARTLCVVNGPEGSMKIDLVACIVFSGNKWPQNGFRENPIPSRPRFFVVPKRPKTTLNQPIDRFWRLSFQEQERELIKGKERLKPTVRLLKKLRDNLGHHCIASYYIKTVILHVVKEQGEEFWNKSLSEVFMTVLKRYQTFIEDKRIPYYWNTRCNLLAGIRPDTLTNISNRLRGVIRDIERNPENVAYYLEGAEVYLDNAFRISGVQQDTANCIIL